MSSWRSIGPTCAVLLLACTKANPAFDPDASAGASEGVGLTGDTSGPAPPPTSGPSTGPSTSTSASDGLTDTGAVPTGVSDGTLDPTMGVTCGLVGEPCGPSDCCRGCGLCMAGTCAPDPDLCGPCGVCGDDSECTPRPPRSPCDLVEDPCVGKTWGLDEGICYANAPAGGGCDEGGRCQPQACAQGEKILGCDVACIVDPGNCGAGLPVEQVNPFILCAQNGSTAGCKTECVESDDDLIVQKICSAGACVLTKSTSCGKYKCKDEQSCMNSCQSAADCKGVPCNGGLCL